MLDPGQVQAASRSRADASRASSRRPMRWLGPGVVVSVAYVDPGNFATNAQAGALLGSRLLWVVVAASVAAMLIQYLAAKLGAVTGLSLPELCRFRYPRPVTWALWLQAEVVIMATDLAEVLGGALALNLLLGLPLPLGGLLVAAASVALLAFDPDRRRRFHAVIGLMLLLVLVSFVYQAWSTAVDVGDVRSGLVPRLGGQEALILATGIIGATVMPHAIYLHTGLARARSAPRLDDVGLGWHRRDVVLNLGLASCVNMMIMLVAAQVTYRQAFADHITLEDTYARLLAVGGSVGVAFAAALLVSGLAASGVGISAGDVVMVGFLRRRVPALLRRLLTLSPALLILVAGWDLTAALVWSQVVLSLGIPFALFPLVQFTASRATMGSAANSPVCTAVALVVSTVICGLNTVVIMQLW